MARTLPALIALLLLHLPTAGLACSPIPNYWWLAETVPADGQVQVPVNGGVAVLGRPDFEEAGWDLLGVTVVEVTRDGEPVPGQLTSPTEGVVYWQPEAPLEPLTEYVAEVRLENWESYFQGEGETERSVRFQTGEHLDGAPPAPAPQDVSTRLREEQLRQCVAESFPGDCEWCAEWVDTGVQQRLQLQVSTWAFSAVWDWAYVAEVWVSRGPEAQPQRVAARARAHDGLSFNADLGPRREWPSDEICVFTRLLDPAGGLSESETICLELDAYDRSRDEPPGQAEDTPEPSPEDVDSAAPPTEDETEAPLAPRSGGCTSIPGRDQPVWALFALLAVPIMRRRR